MISQVYCLLHGSYLELSGILYEPHQTEVAAVRPTVDTNPEIVVVIESHEGEMYLAHTHCCSTLTPGEVEVASDRGKPVENLYLVGQLDLAQPARRKDMCLALFSLFQAFS